jgi:hypothetical protein
LIAIGCGGDSEDDSAPTANTNDSPSAATATLITPGDAFAVFSDASDDGSAVFFNTTGGVIGNDVDLTSDVYGTYLAP